ncbi:MarR family transcriptional regulator [Volucribacter amazonae]|uniref:MarR family transcriptional regulator n=1 Tax=Volucribacter amazonae TaxID=256731 RepID=UPI0024421448|nr:MarR family transcriptional regulator [Volucribacter amazonae]
MGKMMCLIADGKAKEEPVWQATQQLADKTFTKLDEKKTAQLFALLVEFCMVCREQIDKIGVTDKGA